MSEHQWVQESLGLFLAKGLPAGDAERLRTHLQQCPECAQFARETKALERRLTGLFASQRPDAELADTVLAAIPQTVTTPKPKKVVRQRSRAFQVASIFGVVVLMIVAGSVVTGTVLDPDGEGLNLQFLAATRAMETVASAELSEARRAKRLYEELSQSVKEKKQTAFPVPNRDPDLVDFPVPNVDPDRRDPDWGIKYSIDKIDKFSVPGVATGPNTPGVPSLPDWSQPFPVPEPVAFQIDPAPAAGQRKLIIRTGTLQFDVDSYDVALAFVEKAVAAVKGASVLTKGKQVAERSTGSVVIRVPPETLDDLVDRIRRELGKVGELKSEKIGSEDVSKQYTDLESRLKAARVSEERFLKMIKDAKGEIKDLVEAEKALAGVRTKVEEIEGELRYYANQIGLSTLTVTLQERDVTETERNTLNVEVAELDEATRKAHDAIAELKGRLLSANDGKTRTTLRFEVAPELAGTMRDRLKALGTVLLLDNERKLAGTGLAPLGGKAKRGDAVFEVTLFASAHLPAKQIIVMRLAVTDVVKTFPKIRDDISKATTILHDQMKQADRLNVTGELHFEVRRAEEIKVLQRLADLGEELGRDVKSSGAGDSATDSKVIVQLHLVSAALIKPRKTYVITVRVSDVDNEFKRIEGLTKSAGGAVSKEVKDHTDAGRVTNSATFDVPLAQLEAIAEEVGRGNDVRSKSSTQDSEAPEGKLAKGRLEITFRHDDLLGPDRSFGGQFGAGLSLALQGLSLSLRWLVIAVVFFGPWLLLAIGGLWLYRRMFPTPVNEQAGES